MIILLKKNSLFVLCEMVHLNYKRFGQMRSCLLVDVKTIPPNKNRFVFKNYNHQYTMCEMIKLDNERSAVLLRNGLSKIRIHANIYKWFLFNVKSNDLIERQMV